MNYNFTNKSIPNFVFYSIFSIIASLAIWPIFIFTIGLPIGYISSFEFVNIIYFLVCFYFIYITCRKFYFSNSYLSLSQEKAEICYINFWHKVVEKSINWQEIYKIELFYKQRNSWLSNLIFRQKRVSGYNFMIFTNSQEIQEINIPQEIWQNSKKVKEIIRAFENIKETKNLNFEIQIDKQFFFFLKFGQIVLGIIFLLFTVFVAIYLMNFLNQTF